MWAGRPREGCGVIVNYGANIGHDCVIRDFALIGPGAVLTGDVRVCAGSLAGAGAVILPGLSVGSGAVVTRVVTAGETVVGSPAKQLSLTPSRGGE